MHQGTAIAAAAALIGSLGLSATPDDFDLEIVKAGTGDRHEIELPAPGGSVDAEVLITSRVDHVQGWSFGVLLEADQGVTGAITHLRTGPDAATVRHGDPPDYESLSWYTHDDTHQVRGECRYAEGPCEGINAGSFVHGVTLGGPVGCCYLNTTTDFSSVQFTVQIEGPADGTARLLFSEDIGWPPLDTGFVHGGLFYAAAIQTPATIRLVESPRFRRGDSNCDGAVNMADAIYIVQLLFCLDFSLYFCCQDAADANDDETVNIADTVYILQYLFVNGPSIPPPFPACGVDPPLHPWEGQPLPDCEYCPEACQDPPRSCR